MPRPRKNFKIRPPKFLGLHRLKFQSAGTYTGHYKGPAISERRLNYARQPRRPVYLPFVNAVVGSALTKSRPVEALSSKAGECVYLFSNVRTDQVIYSRTGHVDPKDALPQLVFYGKKTVPEKYRKDDWRPYAVVQLRSKLEADHVYNTLRDLRLLRDYAWRKPGTPAPNKEQRKKLLMNQKGTAICDLSTAIAKSEAQVVRGNMETLMQWKAVEALALEATTGGLAVLRKQLSRAQRMLSGRKLSKKLRRFNREVVVEKVKVWYMQQAMMQNAVSAVTKFRHATLSSSQRTTLLSDGKQSLQERRSERQMQREELREAISLPKSVPVPDASADSAQSVVAEDDISIAAKQNGEEEDTLPQQQRVYVLHTLLPWMITRVLQGPTRNTPPAAHAVSEAQLSSAEAAKAAEAVEASETSTEPMPEPITEPTTNLLPIWDLDITEPNSSDPEYLQANYDRKYLTDPAAIKVFWNGIEDRKFTIDWPTTLEHRPMGPLMGIDQYFFRSPVWYLEHASSWETFPFFIGDQENTGEAVVDQAARRKQGLPAEPETEWKPRTKKQIKKHRKGETGAARKEWRIRMGYEEDTKAFKAQEKKPKKQDSEGKNDDMLTSSTPPVMLSTKELIERDRVREHYEQYFAILAEKTVGKKQKIGKKQVVQKNTPKKKLGQKKMSQDKGFAVPALIASLEKSDSGGASP